MGFWGSKASRSGTRLMRRSTCALAPYGSSTIRYQTSLTLAADISPTSASRGMTYRVPDLRRCNDGLIDDFFEISLDIVTERASAAVITARIWPLSVTESLLCCPHK